MSNRPIEISKVILRSIGFLTVCMVVIQGAPSFTNHAVAPLVCGHSNYTKWILPCGGACTPEKDSGTQMAKISETLGTIRMHMEEAHDMTEHLKEKYRRYRISSTEMVTQIEREQSHVFMNGNIDFIDEVEKVNLSNVTEMITANYDSMVAAIMFAEQIRFNEDSSHVYRDMSEELKRLSDKLATILCEFERIECISGNMPSTQLTCQSTVSKMIEFWKTEEYRMRAEYWILRDIQNYLATLISKYQLI
ncbi:hypothetical protein CHS0354_041139 [Potamilus streckersoni]|uniref:Uncharacterized protein n=1 Tax=Potamilus streckersoni TaxID=2493646 RepID=A0AAE0SDS7_9BIVA|nr:hypothetical protein CHS0354_041139 [Potamilus streckersoni]